MMELKEFQRMALDDLEGWIRELAGHRPAEAWEAARPGSPHKERADGAGRQIPHACIKIPTGGGKTLVAAHAIGRLGMRSGLVLWVVPTVAIYDQTRKSLWDRGHPNRRTLERASEGRLRLFEKDDQITRQDTESHLCVMLLRLPAVNRRRDRDFLRIFRPASRYRSFFPPEDDVGGNRDLLEMHPDLKTKHGAAVHSLSNVLKMLRPAVVLDEAHRAYGRDPEKYVESINRFDPGLVIEMSATPDHGISNVLVDVSGTDLKSAQMIKLPINVGVLEDVDWKNALRHAHERLCLLEGEAESSMAAGGRYIRPIGVVRVERTGRGQRGGGHIHADDAREHLHSLGVPPHHIAVQSSSQRDLDGVDLLSPDTPIRWIITKDALKEGWDCPFAYVLAILDNLKSRTGITQLLGRVMRQPHAMPTGTDALDQCYVFCNSSDTEDVMGQVKEGLEREGLTGLGDHVDGAPGRPGQVTIERREQFRDTDIFLPRVLHRDGRGWTELDYERHILSGVDWDGISAPDIPAMLSSPGRVRWLRVDVDGDGRRVQEHGADANADKTVTVSMFVNRLDMIPNRWHAARVVGETLAGLRAARLGDDGIFDRRDGIAHALQEHVSDSIDGQTERIFRAKVEDGDIRFDLEIDGSNYRMAERYTVSDGRRPLTHRSPPVQRTLFETTHDEDFANGLERSFAAYLDGQAALAWWHRVVARQRGEYYLRGWKRDRIYPDFVAKAGTAENGSRIMVFETKGGHLRNPDTEYKRKVLETLEGMLNCGAVRVTGGAVRGTFRLVYHRNEFSAALADIGDGRRRHGRQRRRTEGRFQDRV